MSRVERMRDGHGTDVTIDHDSRTVRGRVALPAAGPCPHVHTVYVDGANRNEPCIGQAGHLGDNHADAAGRTWPVVRKDRKRRRGR